MIHGQWYKSKDATEPYTWLFKYDYEDKDRIYVYISGTLEDNCIGGAGGYLTKKDLPNIVEAAKEEVLQLFPNEKFLTDYEIY